MITFEIVEPKLRMISAAPCRDQVVHHALCNVIAPIFEKNFHQRFLRKIVQASTHIARRFANCLDAFDYARIYFYKKYACYTVKFESTLYRS